MSIERTYWHSNTLDEPYDEKVGEICEQAAYDDANLVSSLTTGGKHAPTIDIDVPCQLIPSSTEGHSHLLIDVELDWPAYRKLLVALVDAGIVEAGYLSAMLDREQTFVRRPGVYKPTAVAS